MTFKEFYNSLSQKDYKDCDLIIHFRIATHGGVNKECTHPFVISKNIDDLKKLDCTCRNAFVHNGIISGYGDRFGKSNVSDTMEYITKIIANIPSISHTLLDNLAHEKSSRFAILSKNSYLIGGDWIDDNGLYFSNSTYKPTPKVVYTPKTTTTTSTDTTKVAHKKWATKTCDCCGQKCYFTHKLFNSRYGDYLEICSDCYYDYYDDLKYTDDEMYTR